MKDCKQFPVTVTNGNYYENLAIVEEYKRLGITETVNNLVAYANEGAVYIVKPDLKLSWYNYQPVFVDSFGKINNLQELKQIN